MNPFESDTIGVTFHMSQPPRNEADLVYRFAQAMLHNRDTNQTPARNQRLAYRITNFLTEHTEKVL